MRQKEGVGKKKVEGKKKSCAWKGREYFQKYWGKFSTLLCLETFPSILKNERKEEEKDMQGREENIFKGGSTMLKPFPAP